MKTYVSNCASKLTKIWLTKSNLLSLVGFFLVSSILIIDLQKVNAQNNSKDTYKFTIVIDAGHGGKDSGALGSFSEEKDIVLKIALKLGELIHKNLPYVKVVYTRTDDTFIPLHDRSRIANENKANLFVSLHANSSKNTKAQGTETFVMGLHKTQENLEVAQKENAVIALEEDYSERYEGYDPNSAESYIIFSLMQNAFLDQSLQVADIVQKEFTVNVKRRDRGVKQAGFLVLWNSSMPSVLVEVGFISNRDEEVFMNSAKGQNELAMAIFNSVRTYFEDLNQKLDALNESKDGKESSVIAPSSVETISLPKKGIVFSVQLTASKAAPELNKPEFNALKKVFYLWLDGFNKYYHGVFHNYDDARNVIDECKKYFPGAFITAFEDGKPISVDIAIRKSKK
jgi:N-acetylmuramoyl-L-alanine amidase